MEFFIYISNSSIIKVNKGYMQYLFLCDKLQELFSVDTTTEPTIGSHFKMTWGEKDIEYKYIYYKNRRKSQHVLNPKEATSVQPQRISLMTKIVNQIMEMSYIIIL